LAFLQFIWHYIDVIERVSVFSAHWHSACWAWNGYQPSSVQSPDLAE